MNEHKNAIETIEISVKQYVHSMYAAYRTMSMIEPIYNNNISDQVALVALDEQNMPSSDACSDSDDETIKESNIFKWISDYEDVSCWFSVFLAD